MITLMDPELDTETPAPAPGTPALYTATLKGNGPSIGSRRSVRYPATAKGTGPGMGTRRSVRYPATAKGGGPSIGTRRSVRYPATAKGTGPSIGTRRSVRYPAAPQCGISIRGGVSVGERSRRVIPVGPSRL